MDVYYKIHINGFDKINKSEVLKSLGVEESTVNRGNYYINLDEYVKRNKNVIMSKDIVNIKAISKYIHDNSIVDELELVKLKCIEGYIDSKVSETKIPYDSPMLGKVERGMTLLQYIRNFDENIPILEDIKSTTIECWGSTSMIQSIAIGETTDKTMDIFFRVKDYPLNECIMAMIIQRIKNVISCDIEMYYMEEFMKDVGRVLYKGLLNTVNFNYIYNIGHVFKVINQFHKNMSFIVSGYNYFELNPLLIDYIRHKDVKDIDYLVEVINNSKLNLFNTNISLDDIESDIEDFHSMIADGESYYEKGYYQIYKDLMDYIDSNYDSKVLTRTLIIFIFDRFFKFINTACGFRELRG